MPYLSALTNPDAVSAIRLTLIVAAISVTLNLVFGLIAKIESRHIVKIYDQGFTDRHVYIAMEYFANGDLRARIKKGVQPAEALGLLKQVALALEAIHKFGIVHRDLKPENIMFRADDSLAIVDFGIAKITDQQQGQGLTQTGEIFGSPLYMSPEQCKAKTLDARSDIYSLACVLCELVTGEPPYKGDSALETLMLHINSEAPEFAMHLPGDLEKCL